MANNRMYLVCKFCKNDPDAINYEEAAAQPVKHLAKYYPSTGWYINRESDQGFLEFAKGLDAWFTLHTHYVDNGEWFGLEYE